MRWSFAPGRHIRKITVLWSGLSFAGLSFAGLSFAGLSFAGLSFAVLSFAALAQASALPIYSDTANAKADIQDALQKAKQEHKRVILDFGGNWCGDCHVLDIYFHDPSNLHLLNQNYELVDVDIGRYDRNVDVAKRYGIPLEKGVPALVVLAPSGKVLYAQTHGEFEKMSHLESGDVTRFLMQWKPETKTVATKGGR